MNTERMTKAIRFFKKHVSFDRLDDIYTIEEKRELMAYWKALEKAHNKVLEETDNVRGLVE